MRVVGVQHDIVWEDRDANFAHLAPMIEKAAHDGARLVVCTEMFSTGFSMKTERIAEPHDGPSVTFLVEQAQRLDVWTCGSLPELAPGADRAERPFNQLVVAAPDGAVHRYAKIHPFGYGREDEHFAPGDHFLTVAIDGVRCTFFVCYDLRFGDEFWTLAPDTDCYVIPANWPAPRAEHWTTLLQARAIENLAYVVGINRVGDGGKLHYAGGSLIVDPFGEVLARAGESETLLAADVEAARVAAVRAEYGFLEDRR
jgi:predicted amidohydrolase